MLDLFLASVAPGDALTITGTGFSATVSYNFVIFGSSGKLGTVTSASETELVVTVPDLGVGEYALTVSVRGKGIAQLDVGTVTVAADDSFEFTPASGSGEGKA